MSAPAALCDPFAASLFDERQLSSTMQASLVASMGPDPTTNGNLPPLSLRSRTQLSTTLPSLGDSAVNVAHLVNLPYHLRKLPPSIASDRSSRPNDTNLNNLEILVGVMPDMSQRITKALHKFIQEERLRNFSFLAEISHHYMKQEQLLVVSPAQSEDIQDAFSYHHDFTAYSYQEWFTFRQPSIYNSLRPTVMITIPEGNAVSVDEMTIAEPNARGNFISTPAVKWLREKYDWNDEGAMKFSENQYEEQLLWWKSNKQSFRLLDMPGELRDAIYLQIIGPTILPDLHASQTVSGRGLSYGRATGSQKHCDPNIEAPNMAIMRVNRQVWREVSHVAARDSQKRLRMVGYNNFDTARRGPSSSLTDIAGKWLTSAPQTGFFRKLQLEMSAASYFESIGIKPTAGNPLARAAGGFSLSILRKFTALRELDFRFIGPKHPDSVCPWALINNTCKKGEHSCQKRWIDWFFILGWDVLKHLRQNNKIRYTLSGCVKTSSRQYWERVLNSKGNNFGSMIKATEMHIRQQKRDHSPIACECSTPCSKADAAKDKSYLWSEYDIEKIVGLQEHIDDIYWSFRD